MNSKLKYKHLLLIVFIIILIDQISKIYIKLNFTINEYVNIFGDWSKIFFIENEGMAFGMTLSESSYGKLALTLFRLVAVSFGFYYLNVLVKKNHTKGLLIMAALILAGAFGNLIDSIFYGMIFTESTYNQVAELVPWGEGYASLFHGKVVDMLYFPMVEFTWPTWMPMVGGDNFLFFAPIFNVADVSITTGVLTLLVFQKRFLPHTHSTPKPNNITE